MDSRLFATSQIAQKKSFHSRPCTTGRTSRTATKISKGSNLSSLKNRKRRKNFESREEGRLMLNDGKIPLETEGKFCVDLKTATLLNAAQASEDLPHNGARFQAIPNFDSQNKSLVQDRKKLLAVDLDAASLPSSCVKCTAIKLNEEGKVKSAFVSKGNSTDPVEPTSAPAKNSPIVMKIKLPGSDSCRELDCGNPDTPRRRLAKLPGHTYSKDHLPIPALRHGESILGLAGIKPEARTTNVLLSGAAKIFNRTIDWRDSRWESDFSKRDPCDLKNSQHRKKNRDVKNCTHLPVDTNIKSDTVPVKSEISSMWEAKKQSPMKCEVLSGRPAYSSVGVGGTQSNMTAVNTCEDTSDYTLGKHKLSKSPALIDSCSDSKSSQILCLHESSETRFLSHSKDGFIPMNCSLSDFYRSDVNVNKEIVRSHKNGGKMIEGTEKNSTSKTTINVGSSEPLVYTCQRCRLCPGQGSSSSERTPGYHIDSDAEGRRLNQEITLAANQSQKAIVKNHNQPGKEFGLSIHINFGNLVQAERTRACCHSSDGNTSVHHTSQTTALEIGAKISKTKNFKRLLSCHFCSFRAISDNILEQHTRLHDQLLATTKTNSLYILTDAKNTSQTHRDDRNTDKHTFAKRKLSIPNVPNTKMSTQGKIKMQKPCSAIETTDYEGCKTKYSLPLIEIKSPGTKSKLNNNSPTEERLSTNSKACIDSSGDCSRPKFYCKYCNFTCTKQQKYANHMRYCPLARKTKPCKQKPRRHLQGTRRALRFDLASKNVQNFVKSDPFNDDNIISNDNDNTSQIFQEETSRDGISSGYINNGDVQPTSVSAITSVGKTSPLQLCSREIRDVTTNLSTQEVRPTVSCAYQEVLYKCSMCDFTTVVMSSLKRHVKHHPDQTGKDRHRCPMCAFETTEVSEMRHHFLQLGTHDFAHRQEPDLVNVEQVISSVCSTSGVRSELVVPADAATSDETRAIWAQEQSQAKVLPNQDLIEAGTTENQPNLPFPAGDPQSIVKRDAFPPTNHFSEEHFDRRQSKIKNTTPSIRRCSNPGCRFVSRYLAGLRSHERSNKHVYPQ